MAACVRAHVGAVMWMGTRVGLHACTTCIRGMQTCTPVHLYPCVNMFVGMHIVVDPAATRSLDM